MYLMTLTSYNRGDNILSSTPNWEFEFSSLGFYDWMKENCSYG